MELSDATRDAIRRVMRPEDQQAAAELLERECGDNLPLLRDPTPYRLERWRFAALKLSKGTMEGLTKSVAIAKRDWRDLLVWAGFGNDLEAHHKWLAAGAVPDQARGADEDSRETDPGAGC